MSEKSKLKQNALRNMRQAPSVAQVYAILELADAIRETGTMVAENLSDIDASITQLAVAVQTSD